MIIKSAPSHNFSSRLSSYVISPHPHRCPATVSVPIPYRRPRRSIARRNWIVTPPQPRIIHIIRTGESNKRSRFSTPTTRNLDLRTRQIHLCAAHILCLVQRDGLDTHEILAGGRVLRDSERHCRFLWSAVRLPCRNTTTEQGNVR
jgi:hypothetical protein